MRRLYPFLVLGTLTLPPLPQQSTIPPEIAARIARIEASLQSVEEGAGPELQSLPERMAHYGVPGVSIAVVRSDRIEWARAWGTKDARTNEPVTTETLFQAASISKPVAAVTAMRLVEDGKLELGEDINRFLTSWKLPTNEFTDQEPVILHHLLSHTGGTTVSGFRGYKESEGVPTLREVLDGTGVANSAPIRVDQLPGASYRYSGGGYTVMQQALIDLEGRPFPEIAREKTLGPIGMRLSTYEQPLPSNRLSEAASGHLGNGSRIRETRHIYPEMAAAGLWTNPSDLARFGLAIQRSLAGASGAILSQELTALMLTPYVSDNYGLGFSLSRERGVSTFGHGGSNVGFKCTMRFARESGGLGIVVMTNGDRGSQLYREIVNAVLKEYGY